MRFTFFLAAFLAAAMIPWDRMTWVQNLIAALVYVALYLALTPTKAERNDPPPLRRRDRTLWEVAKSKIGFDTTLLH